MSLFGSTIGKAVNYGLSKARQQREDTNLKMVIRWWYGNAVKTAAPHGIPTPRFEAWMMGKTDLTRTEWVALQRWLEAETETVDKGE